LHVILTRTLTN